MSISTITNKDNLVVIPNNPSDAYQIGYAIGYQDGKRDAAAAIEELQAILTEADKKQAYQHDYVCELVAEVEELKAQLPKRGDGCDICRNGTLEDGDTLYKSSDWYGGICFDYIRDIRFCPICGRKLEVQDE